MPYKRFATLFLALMLVIGSFTGCSAKQNTVSSSISSASVAPSQPSPEAQAATRSFTDSCGRTVEIPTNITKIAPSGSLAQIVLYSLCPDKLIGLSGKFSNTAKKFIDAKYTDLPVFGQFYGKNVNMNIEAIAAAKPQIIIDIGEKKKTVKQDMDGIQKQVGIPVIFVEATLDTMSKAYLTLGDILSENDQAEKLSDYCVQTMADAKEKSASIPESKRVKIYYAEGKSGLQTNPAGSIHADVIDMIGAVNVAKIPITSGTGGNEVSIEQILKWAPDAMLFGPNSIYGTVEKDSLWKDFSAIKNHKVYEVPDGPYNWMGRPPSINRLIGIKWLGNLLYPDVYQYDMVKEAKDFYTLFYHCTLTDDQANSLLKNSTLKK